MKKLVRHRGLRSKAVSVAWYWIAGIVLLTVCFVAQPTLGLSTNCGSLVFNRLQASGTNFLIEWFSQSNATYEIASVTNMTSTNWVSLASLYPASSSNLTSFVDIGGATNKAKFYKVAKTGISIALCQSNTFSGIVGIPVEVGIPTSTYLAGISFLLDGQPTMSIVNPSVPVSSAPSGQWSTLYVSNGWHTLQATASYPDASQSAAGDYNQYVSQVVTVQTANPIVFPDFPTTFGTALPITALLSSSNASWTATIFDPSNNVLRAYSGSTTTGRIDIVWDGNDTNGVPFSGDFVDVQVSTAPSGGFTPAEAGLDDAGDPGARVRVHKQPVGGFPSDFLVTYETVAVQQREAEAGFLEMLGEVDSIISGGPYTLVGPNSIDNTSTSWATWKTSLTDSSTANLYHFGHGGPEALGVSPNLHQGVYSDEIQALLINGFLSGNLVVHHPYRFVFLDGCNTSAGDWCVAFGTERRATTTAQYAQRGLYTRAFMGWVTIKVYIDAYGLFDTDHYNFVVNFFSNWSNGGSLRNAINQSLPSGFTSPAVFGDDQLTWQ
jgi:hypothetical protein